MSLMISQSRDRTLTWHQAFAEGVERLECRSVGRGGVRAVTHCCTRARARGLWLRSRRRAITMARLLGHHAAVCRGAAGAAAVGAAPGPEGGSQEAGAEGRRPQAQPRRGAARRGAALRGSGAPRACMRGRWLPALRRAVQARARGGGARGLAAIFPFAARRLAGSSTPAPRVPRVRRPRRSLRVQRALGGCCGAWVAALRAACDAYGAWVGPGGHGRGPGGACIAVSSAWLVGSFCVASPCSRARL